MTKQEIQECEFHILSMLDIYAKTVTCEECGYTEEADEDDIEEQYRLLSELDKVA